MRRWVEEEREEPGKDNEKMRRKWNMSWRRTEQRKKTDRGRKEEGTGNKKEEEAKQDNKEEYEGHKNVREEGRTDGTSAEEDNVK